MIVDKASVMVIRKNYLVSTNYVSFADSAGHTAIGLSAGLAG